jgi:hypothetical protein
VTDRAPDRPCSQVERADALDAKKIAYYGQLAVQAMARQKALSLDAIGRVCAGSAVDVAALELPAEQQLADAAGLLTFNFAAIAAELVPMQTVKDGALPAPAGNGGQIVRDVLRWCGVDDRLARGTREGNGWRRSVRRMQLALPCGKEVKVPVVPAASAAQAKADLARRIEAREVLTGVSIPSRVAALRLVDAQPSPCAAPAPAAPAPGRPAALLRSRHVLGP